MTASTNIAGVMMPLGMVSRDPWPYGKKKIYHIDEIKPCKKSKRGVPLCYGKVGMLRLDRKDS